MVDNTAQKNHIIPHSKCTENHTQEIIMRSVFKIAIFFLAWHVLASYAYEPAIDQHSDITVNFINLSTEEAHFSLWPATQYSMVVEARSSSHTSFGVYWRSCVDEQSIQKMIIWKNGQWQCSADLSPALRTNIFCRNHPLTLIRTETGCDCL